MVILYIEKNQSAVKNSDGGCSGNYFLIVRLFPVVTERFAALLNCKLLIAVELFNTGAPLLINTSVNSSGK